MARSDPQINLRIPAELKERIETAARASGRSTNAEIAHRLAESLDALPAAETFDFKGLPAGALDGLMDRALVRLLEQRPDIVTKRRSGKG